MERDLKPLREKMVSAMVYDGWQFVQNAITSIDTAYFCVDTIGKIIKQHEDAYNSWFDGIGQEIAKKKEKGEENEGRHHFRETAALCNSCCRNLCHQCWWLYRFQHSVRD